MINEIFSGIRYYGIQYFFLSVSGVKLVIFKSSGVQCPKSLGLRPAPLATAAWQPSEPRHRAAAVTNAGLLIANDATSSVVATVTFDLFSSCSSKKGIFTYMLAYVHPCTEGIFTKD